MMEELMAMGFMGALKRDDGYWFVMRQKTPAGHYEIVFHNVGKEVYEKYEAFAGPANPASGTESEQSAENG